MDFPPIGQELRQEQVTRAGMSNADLYVSQLIQHTEQAIDHAEHHLAQAKENLNRLRAAHAAGIQWQ